MKKINPWMIITIILVLVIIGILFGKQITGMFMATTSQDVIDKVMKYINENLVSPNTTVTLISVSDLKGIYNISISYQNQNSTIYATKDGNYIFLAQPFNINEKPVQQTVPEQTIGNFFVDKQSEICREDGKPIVYFYGSQRCSLCTQELPIIRNITQLFSSQISYHENIDTDKDTEILLKYNPRGYIPFYIIGCKYFGIGPGDLSGNNTDIQLAQNLAALICSVTNDRPLAVCAAVEQLINQIG